SLGSAGKTASPAQIPISSGYVQADPVSRSISPLRNATVTGAPCGTGPRMCAAGNRRFRTRRAQPRLLRHRGRRRLPAAHPLPADAATRNAGERAEPLPTVVGVGSDRLELAHEIRVVVPAKHVRG